MAIEARDCFINKTTDNQLYEVLLSLNEKFYIPELISRDCFNDLTLNGQLWQIYSAVSGGALWTPQQIPTVFWYDPSDAATITTSGSNVTQVDDKSGNNYTLTPIVGQNPPLIGTRFLNGMNVLEWTGDNCIENTSFSYNQSATPLNFAFIVYHDTPAGTYPQEFYFAGTELSTDPRIYARRDGSDRYQLYAGITKATPNNTISANQPFIIVNQINSTNSLVRINGTQQLSGNIGTNPFQILSLGHNENEVFDLDGYFAEIIGFADNSQQTIVEGYLAWKWGLVANLPAGHPYKNSPPII